MSKEKIILSFVAALLGLSVAGGAFYIYQMTRTLDNPVTEEKKDTILQPTPVQQNNDFLILDNPKDEEVLDKRLITVSGKTTPGSTIIISSEQSDEVITPAANGNFTTTHTIGDGINLIHVTAITPSGEEQSISRTVTFTSEDF